MTERFVRIFERVACQNDACPVNPSHTLDKVRWFKGRPICEKCFVALVLMGSAGDRVYWYELPEVETNSLFTDTA